MISEKVKAKVANATVKLTTLGGQGVLVKPNFIITAAHCIKLKCGGRMIFDEHGHTFQEEIKTVHGNFRVALYAYEPLNDIAILGPLDEQAFYEECEQFESFCEKVKPVPLFLGRLKYYQKFPIYVYTHEKTWIKGTATNWSITKDCPTIGIDMEMDIKAGTSGSPIVNEQGQLVAIMSNAGGPIGIQRNGHAPRPHLALPVWISRCVRKGDFDYQYMSDEERKEIEEAMTNDKMKGGGR